MELRSACSDQRHMLGSRSPSEAINIDSRRTPQTISQQRGLRVISGSKASTERVYHTYHASKCIQRLTLELKFYTTTGCPISRFTSCRSGLVIPPLPLRHDHDSLKFEIHRAEPSMLLHAFAGCSRENPQRHMHKRTHTHTHTQKKGRSSTGTDLASLLRHFLDLA